MRFSHQWKSRSGQAPFAYRFPARSNRRRQSPERPRILIFASTRSKGPRPGVDTEPITFCDFQKFKTGTLEYFLNSFSGPSVKTRFRPAIFPFTRAER